MKGQVQMSLRQEHRLIIDAIIAIMAVLIVSNVVVEVQKQAVHKAEIQKCRDKFGPEFKNGSINGEYVCIKDGEVYNPQITLINHNLAPVRWFN